MMKEDSILRFVILSQLKNKKILYLVDDLRYIQNDCYQAGLYEEIKNHCEFTLFEFNPTPLLHLKKYITNPKKFDKVISVLRLRTLYKHWPYLSSWLSGKEIIIYDQDPWESYIDDSPYNGVYNILKSNLNINVVHVTAPYWRDMLRNDGINSEFAEMGTPKEKCSIGLPIDSRSIDCGFIGSLHPRRKISFEKLQQLGVDVKIPSSRLSHGDYLNYIQKMKIFIFDESQGVWICNQKKIKPSTGMWIKAIEIASRGTFCVRDFHREGNAYNINDIPLIQCFKSINEVPDIVDRILTMPSRRKNEIQKHSVDFIKNRNSWNAVSKKLCE